MTNFVHGLAFLFWGPVKICFTRSYFVIYMRKLKNELWTLKGQLWIHISWSPPKDLGRSNNFVAVLKINKLFSSFPKSLVYFTLLLILSCLIGNMSIHLNLNGYLLFGYKNAAECLLVPCYWYAYKYEWVLK